MRVAACGFHRITRDRKASFTDDMAAIWRRISRLEAAPVCFACSFPGLRTCISLSYSARVSSQQPVAYRLVSLLLPLLLHHAFATLISLHPSTSTSSNATSHRRGLRHLGLLSSRGALPPRTGPILFVCRDFVPAQRPGLFRHCAA